MRWQTTWNVSVLLLGLSLVAAACKSDSSTGTGGSTNLSGTYSLVSFKEDTNPAVGSPFATGTLVLGTSTYHLLLNVDIPVPGDTIVLADSGTYTTTGDSIAEHSSGTNPDALGTFAVKGDTLDINVTESVLQIATIWHKQ